MANFIDQLYNKEYKRRIKTNRKGEQTTTGHYIRTKTQQHTKKPNPPT
jgi:hypothetical protein